MNRWLSLLIVLCAAATSAAGVEPPRVVAVDRAKLPLAQRIATPPVRTLIGYTRRLLHLRDGHTLAAFSYSNSAAANWLFLIDARDLSSRRFPMPNNDIGSHGAALGSDGNIYVMPYHSGRAYRFDVVSSTFAPITVAALPQGECTWDAIGAPDGCIYFGTYPNAILGRYEIATSRTMLWPHVAPDTTYVTDFAIDGAGVRFKAWGPQQVWMYLDAKADAPTRIEAPPSAATQPATLPAATAEPSWTDRIDGAEITIGHYGSLARRDLATGAVTRSRIDNLAPGGNAIMFIESITPDCVIGANYSQQHLFRVNPNSGEVITSQDMIARTPGEPTCAVGVNGKGYIGIYIQSILSLYDPAKPFALTSNPCEIGELFREHHQTRPVAAVTDGQRVYFGSEGDYSTLGGALAAIDAKTQRVDAYSQVVKDQNISSLAWDAKAKLLWGGTNRWGQMHSAPPTQPSAVIFAFDPNTRNVIETLTPWVGVDVVNVIGCNDAGLLLASANGRIAMIDTTSRQVLHEGPWPIAPPRQLRRGADGGQYLLSDGTLYAWDDTANTLLPIAQAPGCTFFTEPSPGLWLFADATSIYRVRLPPSG